MQPNKCRNCKGDGLVQDMFCDSTYRQCSACEGTGMIGRVDSGGIRWTAEDSQEEVRMGYGRSGEVPVPERRPAHLICGVAEGFRIGYTYTIEIPVEDITVIYFGVPVEEHDCSNEYYMVRLDRAISVFARKE